MASKTARNYIALQQQQNSSRPTSTNGNITQDSFSIPLDPALGSAVVAASSSQRASPSQQSASIALDQSIQDHQRDLTYPNSNHTSQPPSEIQVHLPGNESLLESSVPKSRRQKKGPMATGGEPAFRGYVESTLDALLIFEACKRGICPKITRRLQEQEKRLITSGSIFVFEEAEAGIRRWTDGLVWSPSRILQNFLVYRELDKRTNPVAGQPGPDGFMDDYSALERDDSKQDSIDRSRERQLVGSLTSSYRFKKDGLVKKTISISGMHLISYYKMEDVLSGRLRTPSSQPELNALDISALLLVNQNFRVPPQIELDAQGVVRYRGETMEGDMATGGAVIANNVSGSTGAVNISVGSTGGDPNTNINGSSYKTPQGQSAPRKRAPKVSAPQKGVSVRAGPVASGSGSVGSEGHAISAQSTPQQRAATPVKPMSDFGGGPGGVGPAESYRKNSANRYAPYSTVGARPGSQPSSNHAFSNGFGSATDRQGSSTNAPSDWGGYHQPSQASSSYGGGQYHPPPPQESYGMPTYPRSAAPSSASGYPMPNQARGSHPGGYAPSSYGNYSDYDTRSVASSAYPYPSNAPPYSSSYEASYYGAK